MDTVFIEKLRLETIIGCYKWEKEKAQPLILDIEMAFDTRPAAKSDDLAQALDYARVCERIESASQTRHFELVESLAEYLASIIMDEFSVSGLRLRLCKLEALPQAGGVGVTIKRGLDF